MGLGKAGFGTMKKGWLTSGLLFWFALDRRAHACQKVRRSQDAAVSSLAPGTGTQQGTVYTGDVIQGKKVISALDVNDLEPGKHLFYFQGVQMPAGQHWYVSVFVVKGAKAGKRIALISGVHGGEISSVHTIQTV